MVRGRVLGTCTLSLQQGADGEGACLGTCTLGLQQGADGEGACPGHVYVKPAAGG